MDGEIFVWMLIMLEGHEVKYFIFTLTARDDMGVDI